MDSDDWPGTEEAGLLAEWNPQRDSFPMAIVWTPIPMLTWLLPPAGHLGIVSSDGLVHDFAGPYYIHNHRKRTAFGTINKYVRVAPSDIVVPPGETAVTAWNKAIARANKDFEGRMHNLLTQNCHE